MIFLPIRVILGIIIAVSVAVVSATPVVVPARLVARTGHQAVVGNVRVTALSATLIRVEPKGPKGFEDRSTFSIVGRDSFTGVPLTVVNQTDASAILSTDFYTIAISQRAPLTPQSPPLVADAVCGDTTVRSETFPHGTRAHNQDGCLQKCLGDKYCRAWVFNTDKSGLFKPNCWPLSSFTGVNSQVSNRVLGCVDPSGCVSLITRITVTGKDGTVLFDQQGGPGPVDNLLHFPSPLSAASYGLTDFPRFFAPAWGPTPIPQGAKVDPALVATNGYDFSNNVNGDTYVFLMGKTLDDYRTSRSELMTLVGPTPVLPDYAFGTWFTWWTAYNETMAKDDIAHWTNNSLPLDIWGLDMNWRRTDNKEDRSYDYPNTDLFADFGEWFSYLKSLNLRTYFNDHPFPVADQTTAKEVAFRWDGLTRYMSKGLTFWWFGRYYLWFVVVGKSRH